MLTRRFAARLLRVILTLTCTAAIFALAPVPAAAQSSPNEKILFTAVDNAEQELINHIRAETVRIDMSAWYLTDRLISDAIIAKWKSGVSVRLIGDRAAIFDADSTWHTLNEFSYVASQGVPIRLRYYPTWFPDINHWKATIFAGQGTGSQGLVSYGSANYTPLELAPASSTIYKDETVYFTDDPAIVGAVKMKFDQMWNDTTPEPLSIIQNPPFMRNWYNVCVDEPLCDETQFVNIPIDTSRRPDSPDVTIPSDLIFGQGRVLLDRMIDEISHEANAPNPHVEMVEYRLTDLPLTDALINANTAHVPVRVIVEPEQYETKSWPEYWLTRYNVDRLWVAGVPLRQRKHDGLTHMKVLVTTNYALNASSNFTVNWERDINHFVPAATKPGIYNAIKTRFDFMWGDTTGFEPFTPEPADPAEQVAPPSNGTNVSTTPTFTWKRAAWAVSYDVLLGASGQPLVKVGNVPAVLNNDPPLTYSWTPSSPLQPGTTYIWRVVSRTAATDKDPTLIAYSAFQGFTTAASSTPPAAPASPSPVNAATNVPTTVTLTWSATGATTYDVYLSTTNPPALVSSNQAAASFTPASALANSTAYFWKVVAKNSSGSSTGPIWSFTTGASSGGALPAPWVSQDIGATGLAGSATFNSGTFTVRGAGADIWGTSDSFQFVSQPLSSDGQIVARIVSLTNTHPSAKAGIMIRSSLAANSAHVILNLKPNGEVEFMTRQTPGGDTSWLGGVTPGIPAFLRLTRAGSTVTGEVSTNGTSWTTVGTSPLAGAANAGLIVLSHTTSALNTSVFDNVAVTTGGGGTLPGAPANPTPASGATGISTTPTLSWSAASGATSYDVRFGTASQPPFVGTQTSTSYSPSAALANGTTYFWQIVAKNSTGNTSGPVWSFTTASAGPSAPGTPSNPSPGNSATGVSTNPTLTWSATGATSYDVKFGTTSTPPTVASNQASASYAPATLANSTTYFWQIVAKNSVGSTPGQVWSFTTAASASTGNIVFYAKEIANMPSAPLHGSWKTQSSATSPDNVELMTPDAGFQFLNEPLASPTDYIDIPFSANANTPYTIWLRLQALSNNKYNDAVWVQFSDALSGGASIYPIGTNKGLLINLATSTTADSLNGWGWQNTAYWLSQPTTITFASSGPHMMRIQVREDGVQLDQVVLSPTNYLYTPPGPVGGDSFIVPKN